MKNLPIETSAQHYINGHWASADTTATIPVYHATTEEVLATIPAGSAFTAQQAISAARAAFPIWSATSPSERSAYLDQIRLGLLARQDEIARTITAEVGMPLKLSQRIQAAAPAQLFELYAKLAENLSLTESVAHSQVIRQAAGVVAAITPWNYPLHQIAAKLGPALAAGCTVVLKPSEVAPLSAFILAEIIDSIDLPAGVFNMVTGYGAEIGEALVTHSEIDVISFTGSTRAGKRIYALASDQIKRIALELGGKSAAIVLSDADWPAAIRNTVNSCYLNSGQTCSALTRLLVPHSYYHEACRLAVDYASTFTLGNPFSDATKLGPLASSVQRDRVRRYIDQAISEGAKLLLGGSAPPAGLPQGYFVQPTILGEVHSEMTIAREEIFGPVLSILTYTDVEQAITIANSTPYGLSGAVWSQDESRALAIARRLRTGQVDINGGRFNPQAPFGGFKQSGLGREFGRYGMATFLEYQTLNLPII